MKPYSPVSPRIPAVAPDRADTEVRQYSSTAALPLTEISLMNCGPSRLATTAAMMALVGFTERCWSNRRHLNALTTQTLNIVYKYSCKDLLYFDNFQLNQSFISIIFRDKYLCFYKIVTQMDILYTYTSLCNPIQ